MCTASLKKVVCVCTVGVIPGMEFAIVGMGIVFVPRVFPLDGRMYVVPCSVRFVLRARWLDILWIMIIGEPLAAAK